MSKPEFSFPLNTIQVADLLGLKFYNIEYLQRARRITMPERMHGRRLWFPDDVLRVAKEAGKLTPAIEKVCAQAMTTNAK